MTTDQRTGYVFHATLTKEALASVLKGRFHDGDCAIVRRVDWADPVTFRVGEVELLLEQWTDGQIFNSNAELRWRQTADGYAVLLLTEENDPGFQYLASSSFTVACPSKDEKHGFLLWGTPRSEDRRRSTDIWWEARIPRPLHYPIKTKDGPPRLLYRLYLDGEAVRWVRLVKLEEVA